MMAMRLRRPLVEIAWPAGARGAGLIVLAAACWIGLGLLSVSRATDGPAMAAMAMRGDPHAYEHPHSVAMFAACWALMVGAMMAPLAIPLTEHVAARSFRERRLRAVTLVLGAYFTVWIAAGAVARAFSLLMHWSGTSALLAVPAALAAAGLWQIHPARARSLRRCRSGVNLAPAGRRADLDCLGAGMRAGAACAKTCLPMMTAVMLGPMRLTPMATLAGIMLWERRRSAALGARESTGACLVLGFAALA